MSNTKTGGQSLVRTMSRKHGSYEKWCEWMRANGRAGGKLGHTGGFYEKKSLVDRLLRKKNERAAAAGRIGGKMKGLRRKQWNQ